MPSTLPREARPTGLAADDDLGHLHRLGLVAKRDYDRAVRLELAFVEARDRVEAAYESGAAQPMLDRLETEAERRLDEYEGFVHAVVETEREEPVHQETNLVVPFAALYAEYLAGWKQRTPYPADQTNEQWLAHLLRWQACEYPGFDRSTSDRQLISAAKDAYVAMKRRRREK